MSSPRRSSLKTVFFWLTFFILALLVVTTSSLATRVYRIEGAQALEIVILIDPRHSGVKKRGVGTQPDNHREYG